MPLVAMNSSGSSSCKTEHSSQVNSWWNSLEPCVPWQIRPIQHGPMSKLRNCPKRVNFSRRSRVPPTESAAVSSTLMVTGMIEGSHVQMLVDTGSAVTILREDVWRRLQDFCQLRLEPPTRSVITANGEELNLLGQSDVLVSIGGLTKKHTVLVAKRL